MNYFNEAYPSPPSGGDGKGKKGAGPVTILSRRPGVLICYGNGHDLGNFGDYAKSIKSLGDTAQYKFSIEKTLTRHSFAAAILNCPYQIKELHLLSHSIGAGLFLGYYDSEIGQARDEFIEDNPLPTYEQIVNFETGVLLTDHLVSSNFDPAYRALLRNKLSECKFLKIWGCNSGVENWVYNDGYWGILNGKNSPKPSIAQALANYLDIRTLGAKSGSSPEYLINGKWVSGKDYSTQTGKSYPYPNEYKEIRLHPDTGDYHPFDPI